VGAVPTQCGGQQTVEKLRRFLVQSPPILNIVPVQNLPSPVNIGTTISTPSRSTIAFPGTNPAQSRPRPGTHPTRFQSTVAARAASRSAPARCSFDRHGERGHFPEAFRRFVPCCVCERTFNRFDLNVYNTYKFMSSYAAVSAKRALLY